MTFFFFFFFFLSNTADSGAATGAGGGSKRRPVGRPSGICSVLVDAVVSAVGSEGVTAGGRDKATEASIADSVATGGGGSCADSATTAGTAVSVLCTECSALGSADDSANTACS